LHDRIISLRGEVCAYKTSLHVIPPLFIEVPMSSLGNERVCVCVCVCVCDGGY